MIKRRDKNNLNISTCFSITPRECIKLETYKFISNKNFKKIILNNTNYNLINKFKWYDMILLFYLVNLMFGSLSNGKIINIGKLIIWGTILYFMIEKFLK